MGNKQENDDVRLRRLLTTAGRKLKAVRGPVRSDYETGKEMAEFILECEHCIEHRRLDVTQLQEL